MSGHEVDSALDEEVTLSDSPAGELSRELERPGFVVPEQVIRDEYVWPYGSEIPTHGVDRALANGAVEHRRHRAQRGTKGAPPGGLDEPHRPVLEADVLFPIALLGIAQRKRDVIEIERFLV